MSSASPAQGPDQGVVVEKAQGRQRDTLEGGCPVLLGFCQDPGPWAEGRVLTLAFKGHLSALRTDYEGRPTKASEEATAVVSLGPCTTGFVLFWAVFEML